MEATVYNNIDVSYLDRKILCEDGRIKLIPADFYLALRPHHLRIWLHGQARYGVPTVELVAWIKERIAGRKAIEVGAGNADLGYHVGITQTDSYMQTDRLVAKEYYEAGRQPPTRPKKDVLKMDAIQAMNRLHPDVIVASWLTHKFDPSKGDIEGVSDGNMFGPDEEKFVQRAQTYIHIGAEKIHGRKRILALPHEELRFPWLISRVADQSENVIYVWDKLPGIIQPAP